MKIMTIIVLMLFGIQDLKRKRISLWLLILAIVVANIYGVYINGVRYSALGVIPGILLFLLASWQPESVGKGDGLLAIAYGSLYGWQNTVIWLMYSFLLVSLIGIFANVFFQKRKLQLPFIPFMGIVHMGMCL